MFFTDTQCIISKLLVGISWLCGFQGKYGMFLFLSFLLLLLFFFSLREGKSPEIRGKKLLEKLNKWLTLSHPY